jgi:hypothetical protein
MGFYSFFLLEPADARILDLERELLQKDLFL